MVIFIILFVEGNSFLVSIIIGRFLPFVMISVARVPVRIFPEPQLDDAITQFMHHFAALQQVRLVREIILSTNVCRPEAFIDTGRDFPAHQWAGRWRRPAQTPDRRDSASLQWSPGQSASGSPAWLVLSRQVAPAAAYSSKVDARARNWADRPI